MTRSEDRQRWITGHPVWGALLIGVPWGLFMALGASLVVREFPVAIHLAIWLTTGVLLFGPLAIRKTSEKLRSEAPGSRMPDQRLGDE